MASGGMAAAGSLCIVYPLDYARTRLASDVGAGKKTFSGLGDCLKKTATGPQGPAGLYAGFGVSLMGIIPYRGFQLGAFDTLVGLNPFKDDKGVLGIVSTFAAAQSAIIAGAGISYPFDTFRRRLQMQAEKPKEEHIYQGTTDCLKKIAAEEGVAAGRKTKGRAHLSRYHRLPQENCRRGRCCSRSLQRIHRQCPSQCWRCSCVGFV